MGGGRGGWRLLLAAALTAVLAAGVMGPLAAGAQQSDDDPALSYQWGLEKVHARDAWDAGLGKGIVIAVIDSGIDLDHEDLEDNILPGHNVLNPGSKAQDDNGRGTHVAGIAAALKDNGKGVAGVAPAAKVLPVKVYGADLSGSVANIVAGIRWAADHGADVIDVSINNTLTGLSTSFRDAIRYAWSKGAIPVLNAGNQALLASSFSDEPAIVVAATTRTDDRPEYSSSVGSAQWGMAAPGGAGQAVDDDDILSTYWPHTAVEDGQARQYGRYAYLAGTAQAAPHVAGAAAVLRGLGLTPTDTVNRLLETARDIGPQGRDSTFGAGLLDLAKAVQGLRPAASTSTSSTTATTTVESTTTTAAAPGSSTTVRRRPVTTRPPTTAAPPPPDSVPTTQAAAPPITLDVEPDGDSSPLVALLIAAATIVVAGGGVAAWRRFAGGAPPPPD